MKNILEPFFQKYYAHSIQIIVRFASLSINFLINILIIRKFTMGIEYSGRYASINAFLALFVSGLFSAINLNYLRSGKLDDFANTLWSNLKIFIFLAPLMVFFGYLSNYNVVEVIIVLTIIMLTNFIDIVSNYYRITEKDKRILYLKISYQIVVLILFLTVPIASFTTFSLIYLISYTPLLIFFLFRKSTKYIFQYKSEKKLFNFLMDSRFLILSSAIGVVYTQIDIYLLNIIRGDLEAGVYRIAMLTSSIFYSIIVTTSTVYLSQISKLEDSDQKMKRLAEKFKKYLIFNLLIGCVYLLLSLLFNKFLIITAFSSKAQGSIIISYILSGGVLFNLLTTVCSYTLVYLKKEKILLNISIPAAVLGSAGNFIMITKYSYLGAAITNLAVNIFLCFGTYYFTIREFRLIKSFNTIEKFK